MDLFLSTVLSSYDRIVDILKEKGVEDVVCHQSEIDRVLSFLSDDESKHVYAQEIVLHALLHFTQSEIANHFANTMPIKTWREYLQKASQFHELQRYKIPHAAGADHALLAGIAGTYFIGQYQYGKICCIEKGDVVIDGGCCLADTAIWFMQNGAKEVHSFEIDRTNLQVALLNAEEFNYKENIHIYPFALSDQDGTIDYTPMDGNIGGGSVVANKKSTSYEVRCVPLDTFCQAYNVSPSFIKMDIEGSEENALRGALGVIGKFRPKLAICLYHKWEHRWTIPLLIRENFDFYSYYIKRSHPFGETVLFCVPKK